jgi:CubicO group peptidase (beta-lactamase class C family)
MTYKGKVIFARSYGYIDYANQDFSEPDSRFRFYSVTKSVTAMGIMRLVHDGKLTLNTKPFQFSGVGDIIAKSGSTYYYSGPSKASNPAYNSDLTQITVGDLLHHAGGWNRDLVPDLTAYSSLQPLTTFLSTEAGKPVGPPNCTKLLAFVESQPLQVKPPVKETHYSNVGFCALSQTIAETSGESYYKYITKNVFTPLGMVDSAFGGTTQASRLDRESIYYDFNDPSQASLFPIGGKYPVVPAPYSTIGSHEAQEGAAQMVSTAIDIAKFGGAIASGNLAPVFPPPVMVCLGPGAPPECGWPENYYSLSSTLPSYECVDVSKSPPYAYSDTCPCERIPLHRDTGWCPGDRGRASSFWRRMGFGSAERCRDAAARLQQLQLLQGRVGLGWHFSRGYDRRRLHFCRRFQSE